jgi:NADPH-dependent 2,4-dienoyl-CoA reductase/sulfur reductase-like enzyme/ferredoxin
MIGLPKTKKINTLKKDKIKKHFTEVLIIGGGPAGLSAAIELGKKKIKTIIVDDKDSLGGKLILQTHKFFGSVEDSYAGMRGFEIAALLKNKIKNFKDIKVFLNSTIVGIFSDKIIGIYKDKNYEEIKTNKLLIATGAREKMLSFPGNTLPGIYGAGAFQTLLNKDLIKPSNKILIIGAGNVGLITGYHAIQAGIKVKAIIEASPKISGYLVHSNKLNRLGVPILNSHTIIAAYGKNHVDKAIIAKLDNNWQVIPKSYKSIKIDTILIAIGLNEINEFYIKAKKWGMDPYIAGDAEEISEASSAMFSGKIKALKIIKDLYQNIKIPKELTEKAIILKSKPGNFIKRKNLNTKNGVFPIFHCDQKIPCNPCTSVCLKKAIRTDSILDIPYIKDKGSCKGCMACIAICPGLAITLIDFRKDKVEPTITLAYEMNKDKIKINQKVYLTNNKGSILGLSKIKRIINNKKYPKTTLVQIKINNEIANQVTSFRIEHKKENFSNNYYNKIPLLDDAIICRCERISAKEIRKNIREGVKDLNHIKAINRLGMGACGAKTCRPMVWRIFQEEGINLEKITDRTDRPLFLEVPIGALAGIREKNNNA